MLSKKHNPDMSRVPLWKKMNLTVEEAAEYSGIGVSKIKETSNQKNCPFVLWNGTKRLIKRKQFEDYLETQYSVLEEDERMDNKLTETGSSNRRVAAVPIWVKPYLTIEEAAEYTGIGRDKLYEMTSLADCPFVLWVGNRRMIKRRIFDEYIEQMYSI